MSAKARSCEEIREILETLSPHTLWKTEDKKFREHLASCDQCRELYEKQMALNRMLDQWEMPKAQSNLQARIMAKVAQVERERAKGTQPLDFWGQLGVLLGYRFRIPAFATLLLMILFIGSVATNIALLRRTSEAVRVASQLEAPQPDVTAIVERVQELTRPSPQQQIPGPAQVIYSSEEELPDEYEGAWQGATVQPALIVILGAPPVSPGPLGSPAKKTKTIEALPEKEELL